MYQVGDFVIYDKKCRKILSRANGKLSYRAFYLQDVDHPVAETDFDGSCDKQMNISDFPGAIDIDYEGLINKKQDE